MSYDPISEFLRWLENEIKIIHLQIEKIIANNPQAYVNSVEWFFDFLKKSIETYKPIAVQNARNYAVALREQYKMYDNNTKFFNPIPSLPYFKPNWINIRTQNS